MSLDQVRAVADAVLYEGYLLYPYRASSRKNRSRWQFGVLGPPRASDASFGEDPAMEMQCLLRRPPEPDRDDAVSVHLRFLQLQMRETHRRDVDGTFVPVDELTVGGVSLVTWDEAVEHEVSLPFVSLDEPAEFPVDVAGGCDVEPVRDTIGAVVGRIVRRRWPLTARIRTTPIVDGGFVRLSVSVSNAHPDVVEGKDAAIRTSLLGAHIVLVAHGGDFVSLLDPPDDAVDAASACRQRRCWPVLAGPTGSTNVLLGAPIILYDNPEVAEQSAGQLFDSTEIDEILTLRVMTMTDDEKAEARATDRLARQIIDRCDDMTAADLQKLHGILRDPSTATTRPFTDAGASPDDDLRNAEPPAFDTGGIPWWDPEADGSVRPEVDAVVVDGVRVAKGSHVRIHPSRRADAQDLFFADQVARVTGVLSDVDGGVHVALVLADDPAADLHEWYGRYLYFSPDELEPLPVDVAQEFREESRS